MDLRDSAPAEAQAQYSLLSVSQLRTLFEAGDRLALRELMGRAIEYVRSEADKPDVLLPPPPSVRFTKVAFSASRGIRGWNTSSGASGRPLGASRSVVEAPPPPRTLGSRLLRSWGILVRSLLAYLQRSV